MSRLDIEMAKKQKVVLEEGIEPEIPVVKETPAESGSGKTVPHDEALEDMTEIPEKFIERPCGHVNVQRPDGKPLKCTLTQGHTGDHECPFNGGKAIWSDAAGVPL